MSNKQCYMPFFYDWCEPFSSLSGSEFHKLFFAMVNYYQNGGEIPKFTGRTKVVADFVFPQLRRAREVSKTRAKSGAIGGKANKSKTNQTEATTTNTTTTTNTSTITSTNTNTTTALDCVDVDVVDDRFAVFWQKYPKKQNKIKAREAWRKLSPDNELLQQMLTALDLQTASMAWQSEGGLYIPSPSSWLNQRRWEDEGVVLPSRQTSSQGSFDTNEFWEAALRRSMAIMEQEQAQWENGGDSGAV